MGVLGRLFHIQGVIDGKGLLIGTQDPDELLRAISSAVSERAKEMDRNQ